MNPLLPSFRSPLLNRRRFLSDAGIGLGAIALTHLLGRQGLLAANVSGKESIRPVINPGPFQFHADPVCVRQWMAGKGYLFCRKGEVREIMRPVQIPGETLRWGLCDGIHRDDHEFVPA